MKRLSLLLALLLFMPDAAQAQKCEEDLERAARVVYTYWSFVIFYPNIVDLPLLYSQYMPQARAARFPDACADVLERFMAELQDGHSTLEYYPGRMPRTRPAITFRSYRERFADRIGGTPGVRVFVVGRDSTVPALKPVLPGSEVLRVGGVPVDTVYASRHQRISGSTPWWRDHIADKVLLLGPPESKVELRLRAPDGTFYDVTVPRPPDPYGYDEEKRRKAWEEAEDTLTVAESAVLDGGWGYLRVHTFLWKSPRKTWRAIEEGLEPLMDRPGLILDLRDNHGGFIESAARTVEHFVNDKTLIARVRARSPGSDYYAAGFWDPKRGVHAAPPVLVEPRKPVYEGPLAVLIDAGCFSACELVAGGLHDIERATLVGTGPTGGGSGTVTGYELASGAVINFSLFVSWRPDGEQIDFKGIRPDVKVSEGPDDWAAGRDPTLEKAIELLEAGEVPALGDMVVIEEN